MERLCKKTSIIFLFIISVIIIFPKYSLANEPNWFVKLKQIKVFKSTRQDVENVFKFSTSEESKKSNGFQTVFYKLEKGSLSVGYSSGRCSETFSSGYNVGENVVTRITFDLKSPIKMSKFNFDLSQFDKYKESDDIALTWSNDDLGIQITGGQMPNKKNLVKSIEFYPTKEQKKEFSCVNL